MQPSASIKGKIILVTGGTGSFGKAFIGELLAVQDPAAIRVFSRDELKQYELATSLNDSRVRYLIGDVRDPERLAMAMRGVDVVVHAAALKHVPICEYNPFEAVQTNIIGAENVVAAAIGNDVPLTIGLSSDKAVNPVNLYGATKLCAEKIFTQGNVYAGRASSRFASVRYGNVVSSRGSVIPMFKEQAASGELTITDAAMTRFWITLDQAVAFVIASLERMRGGEVFVPRIPSMRITDLADAIAPNASRRIIGIRPGEKIHEVLITADESRHAIQYAEHFEIRPSFAFWDDDGVDHLKGEELAPGFCYSSDNNGQWLSADEMREMAAVVSV
jgi:UDP-N-acetylglucosamine 4,6-dehydratase